MDIKKNFKTIIVFIYLGLLTAFGVTTILLRRVFEIEDFGVFEIIAISCFVLFYYFVISHEIKYGIVKLEKKFESIAKEVKSEERELGIEIKELKEVHKLLKKDIISLKKTISRRK